MLPEKGANRIGKSVTLSSSGHQGPVDGVQGGQYLPANTFYVFISLMIAETALCFLNLAIEPSGSAGPKKIKMPVVGRDDPGVKVVRSGKEFRNAERGYQHQVPRDLVKACVVDGLSNETRLPEPFGLLDAPHDSDETSVPVKIRPEPVHQRDGLRHPPENRWQRDHNVVLFDARVPRCSLSSCEVTVMRDPLGFAVSYLHTKAGTSF
jgi:hypothetical protein